MSQINQYIATGSVVATVTAGVNLTNSGTAPNPIINLNANIALTSVNAVTLRTTSTAGSYLSITDETISVLGTDANIDLTLTAKGTGHIIINNLNVSGLTAGTLRSSAGGDITSLADGADGTLLIGKTGDVPIWATLTDGNNITCTEGANSISIAVTGTTDNTLQVGNVGGSLSSLAVGVAGQVLIGNTAADPSWSANPTVTTIYATTFDTNVAAAAVTLTGSTLAADGGDADITINITPKGTGVLATTELTLTTDLAVAHGGTGASTLTDHGILLGNGVAAISATAEPSNGQLLVGSTGNAPVLATLGSANGSITITEGAGTIDLSTTSGIQWTEVVAGAQAMAVDSGYIANNAGLVTCTLPAAAVVGDRVMVCGKGAGGFRVSQNAGQTIHAVDTDTTPGVGGYLASTNQYDAVELLCITANTDFVVLSMMGNITIV